MTASIQRPRRAIPTRRWPRLVLLIALLAPFALVAVPSPATGDPTTANLFSSSDRPTLASATAAREVGVRFTSSRAGIVTGVRFYKGPQARPGQHRAILWNAGGKILAKTHFQAGTSPGWQEITFPTPVAIQPNRTYVVSYYSPAGNYAETPRGLAQPRRSGPLTTLTGAYRNGKGFPRTDSTANFWVDVVFSYDTAGAPEPTTSSSPAPRPTATRTAPPRPTTSASPTPTPSRTATPTPTPTTTRQPSPTPSATRPAPGGNCTPSTTGQGGYRLPNLTGYANDCNTGPRYECTSTVRGPLVTTRDGQVIERMCIDGSLEIRHDNVTVRDVVVRGTGTYAIDIGQDTATCPTNLRVEYTEVDMANAGNTDWGVYQRCAGGHVFDHLKVMYAGRGIMTYGALTINQSYVYSNRTRPGAHRTAFSTHGGSDFTLTGNTFICVNTGCSSSLNIYSDYAPARDVLIRDNVLAGGSICLRGGETHRYKAQTRNIRVINNRFSTVYAPQCGTLQAFAQFDEGAPGNVRSGNVWHESGRPITGG